MNAIKFRIRPTAQLALHADVERLQEKLRIAREHVLQSRGNVYPLTLKSNSTRNVK